MFLPQEIFPPWALPPNVCPVHLRALNPPTIALSPTIKLSACSRPPLDCKLHEGRACLVLVERAGGAQAVGA